MELTPYHAFTGFEIRGSETFLRLFAEFKTIHR